MGGQGLEYLMYSLVGMWAYSNNDSLEEMCVVLISVPLDAKIFQGAGNA